MKATIVSDTHTKHRELDLPGGDHWGFELYLSLFKYSISFIFYDARHRNN